MRTLVALPLALSTAALAFQQPSGGQTFRSGRDVLSITTSVHDGSGAPVADLQVADFTVKIDGQPRTVLAARMYGHDAPVSTASAPPVAAAVLNIARPAGRAVVIAVDRDSIRAGSERALLETAAKMLDTLGPEDAAAAASLPGAITDFTRDRAPVIAAIRGMTGTQSVGGGIYHIAPGEAVAIEHQDSSVTEAVVRRECTERQLCPGEIVKEAHQIVLEGRFHSEEVLRNLTSILDRFGTIHAPKHLILLSAGLVFEQELVGRYRDLAEKAARSHVSLFVVQVDQSAFDASSRNGMQSFGGQTAEGLGAIASITGGQYFHGVSTAAGVFDRIAADINTFYELGVESVPADADGKPHKVEVKVARAGVTVTAPAATAVPPAKGKTPVEALKAALAEPTDVTELPLEVETYVTHSKDRSKVRVLVAAASPDASAPVPSLWGSVAMDGNRVAGAVGAAVDAGATAPWSSSGAIELAPGRYHLRTAIVAGDRIGTLDLPLTAGLRALGPVRGSDVVIGTVSNGRLDPRSRFSAAERAVAFIELSSDGPLTDLAGTLMLSPAGGDHPVARVPLAFRVRNGDTSVVVGEAALDLSVLATGRYAASAVIEMNGNAIGRVSRVIEVTR